jgi:hypothetical protein
VLEASGARAALVWRDAVDGLVEADVASSQSRTRAR